MRVYARRSIKTLDEMVLEALDLLPPAGQKMEFEVFKAKLYASNPSKGRDVFAHIIKNDLAVKELGRNASNKIVVNLSRKATN